MPHHYGKGNFLINHHFQKVVEWTQERVHFVFLHLYFFITIEEQLLEAENTLYARPGREGQDPEETTDTREDHSGAIFY